MAPPATRKINPIISIRRSEAVGNPVHPVKNLLSASAPLRDKVTPSFIPVRQLPDRAAGLPVKSLISLLNPSLLHYSIS
jgi:hypothetical protein